MQIKLIAAGLLLISIAAGLYWADSMIEENTLLREGRDAALAANASVIEDNNYLLNEIRTRDADILARENYIRDLTIETTAIKEELADAKENLSADELICLESDIPVPYRDQLLQRTRRSGEGDGAAMPVISVLPEIPVF